MCAYVSISRRSQRLLRPHPSLHTRNHTRRAQSPDQNTHFDRAHVQWCHGRCIQVDREKSRFRVRISHDVSYKKEIIVHKDDEAWYPVKLGWRDEAANPEDNSPVCARVLAPPPTLHPPPSPLFLSL